MSARSRSSNCSAHLRQRANEVMTHRYHNRYSQVPIGTYWGILKRTGTYCTWDKCPLLPPTSVSFVRFPPRKPINLSRYAIPVATENLLKCNSV
ncbi:hypothetical protein POVCU2_0042640 [Plasmodium ovale curtisi]|uniref:Uncharacterized protein n=1 Tax=Plasmodium ovale curtisi TaxID=864141 RepID=A0A1A8X1M1_PLAOA|nr:hypothetical protein POVCU2_0042640 [Plasmodium ovale curtisi]SBS97590.1 hypothetical protein POVCU1_039380 [Plasmodium ovale curtisi]